MSSRGLGLGLGLGLGSGLRVRVGIRVRVRVRVGLGLGLGLEIRARPERRGHHVVHGLRQNGHFEEDTEEEDSGQAKVARESEVVCRGITWG